MKLPDDLREWLRAYCGVTGQTGDDVMIEALTEYRARIEALEPCQHG